jgi:hypothetical protein
MKKLFALVLCVAMMGCAAKKPIVGSANQFDSDTYLTLVTTDSVIQATKGALAIPAGQAGAFPASVVGNVKTALNNLIAAYDVADSAYLAYHTAALAGTATATQQASLNTAMGNVQASTTLLIAAKGGQ